MNCCMRMGTVNCCKWQALDYITVSIESPNPPPVVIRIEMTEDDAQVFINRWKTSENPVTQKIIHALRSR